MTSDECQVPKFVSYGGDESVFLGKGEKKSLSLILIKIMILTVDGFLSLTDLLHTFHAATNLLSINKLCVDYKVFIEFHSYDFYVKDLATIIMVLQRQSEKGLYKI